MRPQRPLSAKSGSGGCKSREKEAPEKWLSNPNLMVFDQAAINACL
jgi:hypothetical protein